MIKQLSSEIFNLLKKSVHNFSPMFFLNDGFFVFSFGFNYLEIIAKAKLFISYYNQTYLAESFNLNIFLFSIRNYIKKNSNKSDKKNIDSNNFLNYLIESISKRNINESEQIIPINFDYDIINPEIFIIEPDSFNANIIINLLKNYNIECRWFIDGEEAYNKIKIYYPSCIVSEVNIPGLSIFELKQKLIEDDIDIPVILLSSKKNDDLLKRSKIHGISYYLKKPYYPTELISVIILFSIKFYENRKKRILSYLVSVLSYEICKYLKELDDQNIDNLENINKSRLKNIFSKYNDDLIIQAINILCERLIIPKEFKNISIYKNVKSKHFKKYVKKLKSKKINIRLEGAFALRFYGLDGIQVLAGFLGNEKSSSVKFKIAESLIFAEAFDMIPLILDLASEEYKEKNFNKFNAYISLLEPYFEIVVEYLDKRYPYNKGKTILAIKLCKYFPHKKLERILIESLMSDDEELSSNAAEIVYHLIPQMFDLNYFYYNKNEEVRYYAIKALGRIGTSENLYKLVEFLKIKDFENFAYDGLIKALETNDLNKELLLEIFIKEKEEYYKKKTGQILEKNLFYFLSNKNWIIDDNINDLISYCINNGWIHSIVSFINNCENEQIENLLILKIMQNLDIKNVIKSDFEKRFAIFEEFILALDEKLIKKFNLPQKKTSYKKELPVVSKKDKPLAIFLLIIILFLPFLLFFIKYHNLLSINFLKNFQIFLNYFLKLFAFYSIVLNLFSILFLIFAFLEIIKQNRIKFSRSITNYFQKGVLPSVSILVPAFREEATIVENVRSLLSLNYPSYELILINDGSPDNTFKVLNEAFELERIYFEIKKDFIPTAEILGVYKSKLYSNLIVIDKLNGGKADSLNAGINFSNGSYICGIDADSLLEKDSILDAIIPILEYDEKVIATGGKIMPVNGCVVKNGSILKIGLSKNILALFQTLEYIRSYFVGRLGWSYLKSLLIISGAFGIFDKKSVVEIGGYMTYRSLSKQNTVGEDMELVVRLRRNALEKKDKFIINYSINATCWTEVQESFKILRKQRDKWQRGLIEILMYHRKMMFNSNYKNIGLFALPYFLIFEVIGPFYEVFGLLLTILGLIFGLINLNLFLFVFISSIVLGIFVSIISLTISKKSDQYFKGKEDFLLIFISFLESLGFRQIMNVFRVVAYFNYVFGKSSWGIMKRKGFKSK